MKTIERMRVDEEVFLDFFREYINWKSILAAMAKMMSRKKLFFPTQHDRTCPALV